MRTAVIFAVLAAVFSAEAEIPMEPKAVPEVGEMAARLARIPRSTLSFKGYIRVTVAPSSVEEADGLREGLLKCATDTVDSLSKTFGLELPRSPSPVVFVYAQDGRTNDTRVVVRTVKRSDGRPFTRIYLPSPGTSDVEQYRLEIARAFLRSRTGKDELPAWLVQGMIRASDSELSRRDRLLVLKVWSSARLPFFPALCSDLRVASGPAAALPGFVADWVREKRLLPSLVSGLADGGSWDPARLAEGLTGSTNPIQQDRECDERLMRLARKVLSPGRAGEWDLQMFQSRLLLYPRFFDETYGDGALCCSFREAIGISSSDAVLRDEALRKAREMPMYAIGRGESLQQASLAYMKFLATLAQGTESQGALARLLDEAEMKMGKAIEDGKNDNR